jgi:CheY-like chemotaxis protein
VKVNVWVIDDQQINFNLVKNSFPQDAFYYCNFYHFNKGMDAVNLINKSLEHQDYELLPDIVFVDYYIEGDGWTGDKITKLIVNIYKKHLSKDLKPFIVAFSSIGRRNEDIMQNGATLSIIKSEIDGACDEIVNNFYDKEAIMSYKKKKILL